MKPRAISIHTMRVDETCSASWPLVGVPPFASGSLAERRDAVLSGHVRSNILEAEAFNELVHALLQKTPEERPTWEVTNPRGPARADGASSPPRAFCKRPHPARPRSTWSAARQQLSWRLSAVASAWSHYRRSGSTPFGGCSSRTCPCLSTSSSTSGAGASARLERALASSTQHEWRVHVIAAHSY